MYTLQEGVSKDLAEWQGRAESPSWVSGPMATELLQSKSHIYLFSRPTEFADVGDITKSNRRMLNSENRSPGAFLLKRLRSQLTAFWSLFYWFTPFHPYLLSSMVKPKHYGSELFLV
jgi:hypothetical protein